MFTETTSQSWFSRLKSAFTGIFVGILLVIAASVLLFWNEGRAVKRYKTLVEGAGLVLSVPAARVDAENEGKLVHITGKAVTKEVLKDPLLGVAVNALRLVRKVEMLQWSQKSDSETKKKVGGSTETVTTYSYELNWSADPIDSTKFKQPEGHQNTATFPATSETFSAQKVTVGAFSLNPSQISQSGSEKALALTARNVPGGRIGNSEVVEQTGILYTGSAAHDQAGDVRISMQVAYPAVISLVARQTGDTFRPYKTTVGGTISLLSAGTVPADEMFQGAITSNTILTWVLRFVGFILMMVGFVMMLRILSVAGDLIPFIGSIIGAGTGFVAFILALVLSTLIIAVAWVFFRPLLALGLVGVAVAAIGFLVMRAKKAPARPAPVPAD